MSKAPVNRPARRLYNFIVMAAFALLPLLIVAAIGLGIFWLLFGMNACISTTRSRLSVAGLEFKVEETDCDTLAKDASISVYGLDDPGRGRTLLFKYGPESYDLPLPSIEVRDQQTIVIAVPRVSDVDFQLDTWNNHSIRYDIGHIYYSKRDGEHAQ